jgi:hypothetical protein
VAHSASPPVHSPAVSTPASYVLGTLAKWRLSPVIYLSNRRPNNPGLLALTRGGAGGLFSVRNVDDGKHYAMEVLHLPSLSSIEYMHAFKKLKVLQAMKHSRISRFVLQLPPLLLHPIWWSRETLYLHIVTVSEWSFTYGLHCDISSRNTILKLFKIGVVILSSLEMSHCSDT